MSENHVGINRGFKFHLLEFLASVLLLALLGFPFWLPLILMLVDLNVSNNPLILLISGERHDYQAALLKVLQYTVQLIPAMIIYYWYKSTKVDEDWELINTKYVTPDNYKDSERLLWKPIAKTGKPANNKKWVAIKPGVMAFKSTVKYKYITYPILIFGLFYSLVKVIDEGELINFIFNYGFLVVVASLLMNFLFQSMTNGGLFLISGKKLLQIGVNTIPFFEVLSVQVIRKQQAHTDSGGELYNVYEANIIYSNNKRYNFLNHGGLPDLFMQIDQINEYLKVDVVVDDATIEAIEAHNKEAILKEI